METNNKAMSVDNEVEKEDKKFIADNRKTAAQLMREEGAGLDIVQSASGKLFFSCGTKQGYISQKLLDAINNNTAKVQDIRYAEVHTEINGEAKVVPTLYLASTKHVIKSFKL